MKNLIKDPPEADLVRPTEVLSWIPILMYHRVVEDVDRRVPANRNLCVTTAEFEAQLRYLREGGYQGVYLDDLGPGLASHGSPSKKPVVLTFDDGYMDTYTHAFPLLKRYGFGATVLLVSGQIGGSNSWDQGYSEGSNLLAMREIREMAKNGIRFGSHGVTHTRLPALNTREAQREIFDSKAALEDLLGTEVRTFGYPYGRSTPAIQQVVREAGYVAACGIDQPEHTLFNLSRVDVAPCRTSRLLWRLKVSGTYFRLRQSRNFRKILSLVKRYYR